MSLHLDDVHASLQAQTHIMELMEAAAASEGRAQVAETQVALLFMYPNMLNTGPATGAAAQLTAQGSERECGHGTSYSLLCASWCTHCRRTYPASC